VKKRKRPPAKKPYKKIWKLGTKEFNTEYFDINKDGELVIHEGNYQYNVYDLARKFNGSSLQIFMPFVVEERLTNIYKIANYNIKRLGYKGKFTYHFPIKVNQRKEFMLPLLSEGAHLETASANQLWLVKKLYMGENFHSKLKVVCNGPKTLEYVNLIKELREKGFGIIPIIESEEENKLFKGYTGDTGVRISLKTRVKSHWDKKVDQFGMDLEEILELGRIRNLKILHYHLGSQMQLENNLIDGLREGFEAYKKIRKINPGLDTLNIGGGFTIPYEKKKTYSLESVMYRIFKNLKTWSEKAGIPHPDVIAEWGQYVTAPAQINVYKIVLAKKIVNGAAKTWYFINGSFQNDLLDTWAIHQKFPVVPVNHMNDMHRNRVWLAGLSCDSDDRYTGNDYMLLPKLEELAEGEDLYIAVLNTGAYQDGFSGHHCFISSPTKVVLQNGIVTVARKKEGPEEIGKIFGW
jgi:arginine decarboxylase